MLTIISLFIGFLTLCYFYLTKNYNYWEKRGIPGPKPSIFVGNYPSIYNKKKLWKDEIEKIYKQYKGKESVVGTYYGIMPHLMILDPEIGKEMMTTHFKHFYNQGSIFGEFDKNTDPLAGRNPFFLKGEEWKEKRNEITPAFSSGRMKALFPIMNVVGNRMKDYIKQTIQESDYIETRELCAKYTTDVVCNTIYGVDSGAFTEEKSELRDIARNVFAPSWRMYVATVLGPNFPFIFKILRMRFIPENYATFLINLLNKTLQYRKENNVQRQDFLDYLTHLKEKKGISDIEVAAHTITFFLDGVETSSITMSYIFYQIAKNKHVQDKLRQEMLNIRKADGTFEYDSVLENKYLDQIFTETMRVSTIIPILSRDCTEDFELKLSNNKVLTIKKGITVAFPCYEIFHDPEYYGPTANTFDPERFNDENGGTKPYKDKGVLYTFGDGPRVCLGQRFAQTQIKCCIAHIVTSFDISLSEKMPAQPEYNPMEFMLCYKGGILLKFKPIDA